MNNSHRKYVELAKGQKYVGTFPKFISVDLETSGLDPRKDSIHGVAFAMDNRIGYYCQDVNCIKELLESEEVEKIFHNAVFDMSFLEQKGFKVSGTIHDTMLLAHNLDTNRGLQDQKLKPLAKQYIGDFAIEGDREMDAWLKENHLGRDSITLAPREILTTYAAEDAINTFELFQIFCGKLQEIRTWLHKRKIKVDPWKCYLDEDSRLLRVVRDMQLYGVKLDMEGLAKKQSELDTRILELRELLPKDARTKAVEDAEYEKTVRRRMESRVEANRDKPLKKMPKPVVFNWDSPNHLKQLFFDVLGETPKKFTKKGQPSLDAAVLETYKDKYDFIPLLLEYKELQKLSSTYIKGLYDRQYGGIVHANFNITGTATGRFSSSNPNLQNLPKHGEIKKLFIPRSGNVFIYADYSQLELRLAAHLSGDPLLIKAYREGLDLHKITASQIFQIPESEITDDQRGVGKRINFAIIYNASGFRLAQELGYLDGVEIGDREGTKQASELGDKVAQRLFKKYAGLKKYIDVQMKSVIQYRIAITQFGRVRPLPHLCRDIENVYRQRYNLQKDSPERKELDTIIKRHNHWLKAGFNMPIQGFGASITRRAMCKLWECGFKLVNQIHDAIIIEVPKEQAETSVRVIRRVMESVVDLDVPLIAEPKLLKSFDEGDVYV